MMLSDFLAGDSGAVTVDWVVLTAFLCGLAVAVVALMHAGAESPSNAVNGSLSSDIISTRF